MLNDNDKKKAKTVANKTACWIGDALKETLNTPKGKKVVGYALIGGAIPAIAGFPVLMGAGLLIGAILGAMA